MADYLEGDLSLNKRAIFDAHLDGCPECAAEIAEMRATIGALRSLPLPEPPPNLASDVMRRIRAGEGHANWSDLLVGWLERLMPPQVAVPVTAVATAVGVLLLTGQLESPLPAGTPERGALAQRSPVQVVIKLEGVEPQVAMDPMAGFGRASARQWNTAPWHQAVAYHNQNEPYVSRSLSEGGGSSPLGLLAAVPAGRSSSAPTSAHTVGWHRALAPVTSPASLDPSPDHSLMVLDDRLQRMMRSPARFARQQLRLSLAEQELWARRLSERARDLGQLDDAFTKLRGTGDGRHGELYRGRVSPSAQVSSASLVLGESLLRREL